MINRYAAVAFLLLGTLVPPIIYLLIDTTPLAYASLVLLSTFLVLIFVCGMALLYESYSEDPAVMAGKCVGFSSVVSLIVGGYSLIVAFLIEGICG